MISCALASTVSWARLTLHHCSAGGCGDRRRGGFDGFQSLWPVFMSDEFRCDRMARQLQVGILARRHLYRKHLLCSCPWPSLRRENDSETTMARRNDDDDDGQASLLVCCHYKNKSTGMAGSTSMCNVGRLDLYRRLWQSQFRAWDKD